MKITLLSLFFMKKFEIFSDTLKNFSHPLQNVLQNDCTLDVTSKGNLVAHLHLIIKDFRGFWQIDGTTVRIRRLCRSWRAIVVFRLQLSQKKVIRYLGNRRPGFSIFMFHSRTVHCEVRRFLMWDSIIAVRVLRLQLHEEGRLFHAVVLQRAEFTVESNDAEMWWGFVTRYSLLTGKQNILLLLNFPDLFVACVNFVLKVLLTLNERGRIDRKAVTAVRTKCRVSRKRDLGRVIQGAWYDLLVVLFVVFWVHGARCWARRVHLIRFVFGDPSFLILQLSLDCCVPFHHFGRGGYKAGVVGFHQTLRWFVVHDLIPAVVGESTILWIGERVQTQTHSVVYTVRILFIFVPVL